jgi:dTDP-glucose 4,6-dehydratase
VVISNCSNNYGPYQLPEKLIPLTILNSLEGHALPVYGDGRNVRDWLFVQDHVKALVAVAERGRVGETYLIGSETGLSNIDVVRAICNAVDACVPDSQSAPRADLIEFVEDRPGHDRRYAVNTSKIREELGWRPTTPFDSGLLQTVEWYLENRAWWAPLRNRVTAGERLGKLHKVSSR